MLRIYSISDLRTFFLLLAALLLMRVADCLSMRSCPNPFALLARQNVGMWSARNLIDVGCCSCRFFGFVFCLFLCHQMAVCLFRCMAAIGRTLVVAYTVAWLLFLLFILLGGYVLTKGRLPMHFRCIHLSIRELLRYCLVAAWLALSLLQHRSCMQPVLSFSQAPCIRMLSAAIGPCRSAG